MSVKLGRHHRTALALIAAGQKLNLHCRSSKLTPHTHTQIQKKTWKNHTEGHGREKQENNSFRNTAGQAQTTRPQRTRWTPGSKPILAKPTLAIVIRPTLAKPTLAKLTLAKTIFGQTDFGQNRLWPNRVWPNRLWPKLMF